jgi:hypothetical protein
MESRRIAAWAFSHYLDIAPPSFVRSGSARAAGPAQQLAGVAA